MQRTKWPKPKVEEDESEALYAIGLWGPIPYVRVHRVDNWKSIWVDCTRAQFTKLREVYEKDNKQPMTVEQIKAIINAE